MKSIKVALWALCAGFSLSACASGLTDSPRVAANVTDVGVLRTDNALLRYVRFNTESDYPCLRFELIHPEKGWQVSAQRNVCAIEPAGSQRLVFPEDVAFVEFTDLTLSESGLQFTVGYMPRAGSGEYQSRCEIKVEDGDALSEPKCAEATSI